MSMTLIEHIEVTSATAASIEFTSIPQTYTDLLVLVSARSSTTADELYIYPNASTSNLSYRLLRGNGSTVLSAAVNRFYPSISTDTASTFANGQCYIPNYTASQAKSFSLDSTSENNATQAVASIQATLWNDTTAISSLKLEISGASFVQYSSATLYGITAGSDGTTTVS